MVTDRQNHSISHGLIHYDFLTFFTFTDLKKTTKQKNKNKKTFCAKML